MPGLLHALTFKISIPALKSVWYGGMGRGWATWHFALGKLAWCWLAAHAMLPPLLLPQHLACRCAACPAPYATLLQSIALPPWEAITAAADSQEARRGLQPHELPASAAVKGGNPRLPALGGALQQSPRAPGALQDKARYQAELEAYNYRLVCWGRGGWVGGWAGGRPGRRVWEGRKFFSGGQDAKGHRHT